MSDEQKPIELDMALSSGIAAFEAKHFSQAQQHLAPLAEQGEPEAQFRMAIMCQNGLGMTVKQEHAVTFMRGAAEQGHALAQHGLGFMYLEGECVEQDTPTAIAWLEKAADQGLQGSLATLAMIYNEGRGVERDAEKAKELYLRAGFDPSEFVS